MKSIKLKIDNLPVDGIVHPKGAVVVVPDARAAELIRLEHAEAHDGAGEIANPDHNPLADSFSQEFTGATSKPAKAEPTPPLKTLVK